MASERYEAGASTMTSISSNSQRDRATQSRLTNPRKPKLGDFLRITAKLEDEIGIELRTAFEETRPSPALKSTLATRNRDVPSLLDVLQRRVGDLEKAASRGWTATDDDESPASAIEDDSHGVSDDASVGLPASPATTTTSPDVQVVDTELVVLLNDSHIDLNNSFPPKQVPTAFQSIQQASVYSQIYQGHSIAPSKPKVLSPYQQRQRAHRVKLAQLANARRTSSAVKQLTLPWDVHGTHESGSISQPSTPRALNSIEPLYHVGKETQLDLITAWLDEVVRDDDFSRSQNAASNQPIHVFVDMSNIIIGFYNRIKAERDMAPDERVIAPAFFFEGFARCLERFRPCAKRVLATSLRAGSSTPAYLLEAESAGYEMNILQRVKGSKKTLQRYHSYQGFQGQTYMPKQQSLAQHGPGIYMPGHASDHGYGESAGFREQGVDELLHLKMAQSLLDTAAPATMVLATGDAAEAEFSDGFHRNVVRALERGWLVEVIGWRDNMSSAWLDAGFLRRWDSQFRVCCLDLLVEELVAGCHT